LFKHGNFTFTLWTAVPNNVKLVKVMTRVRAVVFMLKSCKLQATGSIYSSWFNYSSRPTRE